MSPSTGAGDAEVRLVLLLAGTEHGAATTGGVLHLVLLLLDRVIMPSSSFDRGSSLVLFSSAGTDSYVVGVSDSLGCAACAPDMSPSFFSSGG
ncbi:unnamed protein product, partial [Musa acuminata subsp. malaccensis]